MSLLSYTVVADLVQYSLLLILGFVICLVVFFFIRHALGWKPKIDPNNPDPRLLVFRGFDVGIFAASVCRTWPGSVSILAGPDGISHQPGLLEISSIYIKSLFATDLSLEEYAERGYFARNESELQRALSTHEYYRGKENVLLCSHEIWREAVIAMLQRTDFVVFDISGINRSATGCLFELGILLNTFPLERVLFLCDDQTNTDYFSEIISEIWISTSNESPNVHKAPAEVNLLCLDPISSRLYAREPQHPDLYELQLEIVQLLQRAKTGSVSTAVANQ